jgi:hypothetical protein
MSTPEDRLAIHQLAWSEELTDLAREQYEALQKNSYLNMPQAEVDAYNERRGRIAKVIELLGNFRE